MPDCGGQDVSSSVPGHHAAKWSSGRVTALSNTPNLLQSPGASSSAQGPLAPV